MKKINSLAVLALLTVVGSVGVLGSTRWIDSYILSAQTGGAACGPNTIGPSCDKSGKQPLTQTPQPVKRIQRCLPRRKQSSTAQSDRQNPMPSPPTPNEYFVGEARVEVTKDESVVRLAMAQHGSVLIELPANDGPRYIIPGDPEMATVDAKALERSKRVIVVRPGTQFLPPLGTNRAHTPAATVTVQMRSGLVVTFLFYPVADLTQNVHRCVLQYNRDEVIARRRSAGLPVNLDTAGDKGGLPAPNAAAQSSISIEETPSDVKDQPLSKKDTSLRQLLDRFLKSPEQFESWTRPVHGLSLSAVSRRSAERSFVVIAVRNTSTNKLKLSNLPELFLETINDDHQPSHITQLKPVEIEASERAGEIEAGKITYYAIFFEEPILGAHQRLKLGISQTDAADEPASLVLPPINN